MANAKTELIKMKNWAMIVAGLYALIFVILTVPVILLAFVPTIGLGAAEIYLNWGYWLWLLVMCVAQFALLAIPAGAANQRPVTRSSIWRTVLAGGLMAGGLAAGAFLSLYEFFTGGKNEAGNSDWWGWTAIALGVITWCVWTVIFMRMSRSTEPSDLVSRQCRCLFKGSILELLIAVPMHIVVRCRDYCCAGFLTFIGLTMGISVMLFAFGPAVLVLVVKRWQRLHPVTPKKN